MHRKLQRIHNFRFSNCWSDSDFKHMQIIDISVEMIDEYRFLVEWSAPFYAFLFKNAFLCNLIILIVVCPKKYSVCPKKKNSVCDKCSLSRGKWYRLGKLTFVALNWLGENSRWMLNCLGETTRRMCFVRCKLSVERTNLEYFMSRNGRVITANG